MKRSLILSLCTVALVAMAFSPAFATSGTHISLNLRYDDPNNESAGGAWQLVATTSNANGIAGLSVNLSGAGTAADFTNSLNAAAGIRVSNDFSGTLNVVLGLDDTELPNGGTIGIGSGNGVLGDDVLGNDDWDNAALIASGTFGSARPAFVDHPGSPALPTGANVSLPSSPFADAVTPSLTVRGDGVVTDGLIPGDANRDWTTDTADLAILAAPANFEQAGTWDTGDFNSDDFVDTGDLAILASPFNFEMSGPAPAITAAVGSVPEPSTAVALLIGLFSLAATRRKR